MPLGVDFDRFEIFSNLGMVNTVEDGEIPDSVSVGRISTQRGLSGDDSRVGSVSSNEQRVWTLQDLMKYQMSRNYTSGLHNFAWAQAVQNKPLNEVVNLQDMNNNSNLNTNNNKPNDEDSSSSKTVLKDDNAGGMSEAVKEKVVIDLSSGDDDEKEEGELEEGEIDLTMSDSDVDKLEYGLKGSNKELEVRIEAIREAFESVNKSDSNESFDTVCSQIKDSLDSLLKLILEDCGPKIDELVKLAFEAINTLNKDMSVSVVQNQLGQHKDSFSRLLHHVTSQKPPLFAPEQMKEIECMITSLDSSTELHPLQDTDKEIKIEKKEGAETSMDFMKLETNSFRSRGMLLPLLDVHKDHDEDSLPSPTRDAPPVIRPVYVKPEWPTPVAARVREDVVIPHYGTDALNAFSTYQQKFGQSSFPMSDLPSPTPSENGDNDNGAGDTSGEVSSSVVVTSAKTENLPNFPQLSSVSPSSPMDICSTLEAKTAKATVPVKSSVRSRDPRLRSANKDKVVSRVSSVDTVNKKQKLSSDSVSDGPAIKKQKNMPTEITTAVNSSTNVTSLVNVLSNGLEHLQGAPLDSILRDIAVNPEAYIKLIKMEQQKIVDPVQNKFTNLSSQSSAMGAIPPVNVALPNSSITAQKPAGIIQMPPQMASMNESEKVRMRPRDPRRALVQNAPRKVGNGGPNHVKTSTPVSSSQEVGVGLNSCNQQNRNVPSLKNVSAPDITHQFTKNLKNISDFVSSSQTPTVLPVNPQVSSSQPMSDQNNAISSSVEVSVATSQSQNDWGDVGHLYEGLDDKQKAAFHKERARRIDEQKKMFSARKLCLVLDLDHTLLNSAKFVEVDPVHDEILRKKEEQDREKPYRHLFRFPHMGMWTKLRPGIWNFLERASKLFELHLYTMGNRLYATEMAKLLDPKGTLFSGRVISRGDDDEDGDISKSKDLEGVLGMESGVVIIDDSIRVWPHNKLNLIVVERYIYFPCSRRQFGLLGPSLLEIDHDERPEAGTLASSLAVIERIHQNFYAHKSLEEADVRNILASEQRKILGGCRIVFSRVFPVGEASPHLHPLWQTAEQFGATCTNRIDNDVTHVVAHSLGTDKVNWAIQNGRFVVHPGWVEASALLYRRANEQDFAIKT